MDYFIDKYYELEEKSVCSEYSDNYNNEFTLNDKNLDKKDSTISLFT